MTHSVSDYVKAHRRVEQAYGRADSHLCVQCGSPAQEWAYQYPPGILPFVDSRGTLFSNIPEHYAPMCKTCHLAHDREKDPTLEAKIQSRAVACGEGVKRRLSLPEGREVFIEAGRKAARKRRVCETCGLTRAPGVMALHQRASGHSGYEDLS